MEERREALMKRMANRHEKRILKSRNEADTDKIDLRATEKTFLVSETKELDMKTPIRQKISNIPQTSSPIVSFDDKADQHIAALSTYVNTIVGFDDMGEIDLGENKKEAYKRIKEMLASKTKVVEQKSEQRTKNFHRLFEKYDPNEVTNKCRKLLKESEINDGISHILSKRMISIRSELAIYSDLALQTVLLHTVLSFHPAWLKASLEAIFDTRIVTSPDSTIRDLSKFIIDNVFKSKNLLKNKKFAQGSGIPIVTPAGKEALHNHFLSVIIKVMFLIEKSVTERLIPNLTRMFSRSSMYKSLDAVFADLSKEVLSGSSLTFKKAFTKLDFQPFYKQTFIDDYDYNAKGFDDFSNGIILAKLIEQIAFLPQHSILSKLRDPQGDRIRKLKNVEIVLDEMSKLGIDTENIKPAHIVGCKKEQVLSVLWSIIGVKVCAQKKVATVREPLSFDERVLRKCRSFGERLGVNVPDLDSLYNGKLFAKALEFFIPTASFFEFSAERSLFDQIVDLAENQLCINRDVSNHIGLFADTFFENLEIVRKWHEKAIIIQRTWRGRKIRARLCEVVKLVIEQQKIPRVSNFNDATFTISRDSVASTSSFFETTFKVPKTPKMFAPVKEDHEEEIELDETAHDVTVQEPEESEEDGEIRDIVQNPDVTSETFNEDEPSCTAPEHTIIAMGSEKLEFSKENEGANEIDGLEIEESVNEAKLSTEESQIMSENNDIESHVTIEIPTTEDIVTPKASSEISEKEEQLSEQTLKLDLSERVVIQSGHHENEIEYSVEMPVSSEATSPIISPTKPQCSTNKPIIENSAIEHSEDNVASQELISAKSADDFPPETDSSTVKVNVQPENSIISQAHHRQEEILEKERIFMEELRLQKEEREKQKTNYRKFCSDFVPVKKNVEPTTPELVEILRAKRKIAAEQKKLGEKLRKIEQTTTTSFMETSSKNMAMIESIDQEETASQHNTHVEIDDNNRSMAGNESFEIEEEIQVNPTILDEAAVTIQKYYRGYLARRKIQDEILSMRQKVEKYNRKVGGENEEFDSATISKTNRDLNECEEKQESAQIRLRKHSLFGLPNDNLTIVLLSASTIDRLTSLLPSLTKSFVVEFDGIGKIYDILAVADRGYSYTSILKPLFSILYRCVREQDMDIQSKFLSHLKVLSPRLFMLVLAHKPMFGDICSLLIEIGKKWPTQCHFSKLEYYLKRFDSLADQSNKKKVAQLRKVCESIGK